jgi:hypothetical protein
MTWSTLIRPDEDIYTKCTFQQLDGISVNLAFSHGAAVGTAKVRLADGYTPGYKVIVKILPATGPNVRESTHLKILLALRRKALKIVPAYAVIDGQAIITQFGLVPANMEYEPGVTDGIELLGQSIDNVVSQDDTEPCPPTDEEWKLAIDSIGTED